MKIFASLTAAAVVAAALLFAAPQEFPLRATLFAAQEKAGGNAATQPKKKDVKDSSKSNAAQASDAADRQRIAQFAAGELARFRDELRDDRTYQADLEEQVRIGGRSFTATGKYWKGKDLKSRLELNMVIGKGKDAVKARLLQVCDGEVLMTEQAIGKTKVLTRRNVKQILAAAADAARVPHNELLSEFGLGGLKGLIASLERTMVFDKVDDILTRGKLQKPAKQFEGTWNNTYREHWANWSRQTGLQGLPAHVPERVRVLVDSDHYVRKIDYLQRSPDGKAFVPMVSLSFRNIQLNPKLDDKKLFQYVSEPGVYVEDTTAQYIQLFQPPPAAKN